MYQTARNLAAGTGAAGSHIVRDRNLISVNLEISEGENSHLTRNAELAGTAGFSVSPILRFAAQQMKYGLP